MAKRNRTSTPRFNLDHSKDTKTPQMLYLLYRYKKDEEGKRVLLKYSTGILLRKKYWDGRMQLAKSGTNFDETKAKAVNRKIEEIKRFCIEYAFNLSLIHI